MAKLNFFCDREKLVALPTKLVAHMADRGLVAPDQNNVHYCGFISWQEGIAVFMPRNTNLAALSRKHAYFLFRALIRYYTEKLTGIYEKNENELIGKDSLFLIHSLVEDYLADGLYMRKKVKSSLNSGKPNWKRTITRHTPYPVNGSQIYIDTETSNTLYMSDCETARIHAYVIKDIYKQYGMLLTGKDYDLDGKILQMPPPKLGIESQLHVLEKELIDTYSERDITLIDMLKAYIKSHAGWQGKGLLIGTRNFHSVWEGMIDSCFSNKIEFNNKIPVPYYQQKQNFFEVARKGQRTDTVIEVEGSAHWAVIDAKYYDASSPSSAPGWHDLVKQFFYRTAAEKINPLGVITLHFIFPGTKHTLHKVMIGERGQKRVKESNFIGIQDYGEIFCHYCNPALLIEKFALHQFLDIYNEEHISGQIKAIT